MKIGIITHHYVKNYGAYLQAYALIGRIRQLEADAEVSIVDKVVKKHYWLNVYRRFRLPKNKYEVKTYKDKIKQFRTLTKYEHTLPMSPKFHKKMLNRDYDKIIVGSDEVWNFKDYSYDPLKFAYKQNGIKIYTYAASAGEVLPDTSIPQEVRQGIKNFRKIGVRDRNTKELAERILKKDVSLVLDPTLIYDYDKELEGISIGKELGQYILIYGCSFSKEQQQTIINYAKANNLKIVGAGEYKEWYDEIKIDINPFEWVDLFRNAKIVLTGTFHGLMFSLKYYRNFICMPVFVNRINKTRTILEDLNFTDRLLLNSENIDELMNLLESNVDYTNTKEVLDIKRTESESYIKAVLKD